MQDPNKYFKDRLISSLDDQFEINFELFHLGLMFIRAFFNNHVQVIHFTSCVIIDHAALSKAGRSFETFLLVGKKVISNMIVNSSQPITALPYN